MARRPKLTPKQASFVREYLIDLNATAAARRAGYSARTADKIGPELLGKTSIAEAIAEAMKKREQRTEITQDRVLAELAAVAFANGADYVEVLPDGTLHTKDPRSLTPDQRRAIASVKLSADGEPEISLQNKIKALELLGKHLALFTDRVEAEHDITVHMDAETEDFAG